MEDRLAALRFRIESEKAVAKVHRGLIRTLIKGMTVEASLLRRVLVVWSGQGIQIQQ